MHLSLQELLNLTEEKLKEAKLSVRLFGLDYDGTISDGVDYKQPQVFSLVKKILTKNKSVVFVTARAATALKILVPHFQRLLSKVNNPVFGFIAGGNGISLYQVKKDGLIQIYNHGFKLSQILYVVEAGKKVYEKLRIGNVDLAEKGLKTFRKFLQEDWEGCISSEIVDICRPYKGEFFTEESKVTFVLPKDKSLHGKIIAELNNELGKEYCAVAGDDTYIHITKRLVEDSKIVAIKTILEFLSLGPNQVATFGDMPIDNDLGLLSFPYSFTNSEEFVNIKRDPYQPPFILLYPGLTPIVRVYKAIDYLVS